MPSCLPQAFPFPFHFLFLFSFLLSACLPAPPPMLTCLNLPMSTCLCFSVPAHACSCAPAYLHIPACPHLPMHTCWPPPVPALATPSLVPIKGTQVHKWQPVPISVPSHTCGLPILVPMPRCKTHVSLLLSNPHISDVPCSPSSFALFPSHLGNNNQHCCKFMVPVHLHYMSLAHHLPFLLPAIWPLTTGTRFSLFA